MKILDRSNLPEDYHYYRSHSEGYFHWVSKYFWSNYAIVKEKEGYAFIKHFLGWFFSIATFEKVDIIPTPELLEKYGMKRWLVYWAGWSQVRPSVPRFLRVPYPILRSYLHSTRSAFSILDTPEYWKKWSSNARGHRNKLLRMIDEWKIEIKTNATLEEFLEVYESVKTPHPYKKYFIKRQRFLDKYSNANIRYYIAFVDGVALAGAVFLDDLPTSTYLIAFQDVRGKSYHLGLAIIDRWFAESQELGYKYLDLDHMKDVFDPMSYSGYTKFKSEIADYELKWREVWVKWMW